MLRPGLETHLVGGLEVDLLQLLGQVQQRPQVHVGVLVLGGPNYALRAAGAGEPHRRMGFLNGDHPGVDHPVGEVTAFPAEGARSRPALHDEVVGLFKPVPVFGGRYAGVQRLHRGAPHETGNYPPPGDAVQHGHFFGHLHRVVDGDDVAQHGDFGPFGDLGYDGGVDVHRRLHAPIGGVVFVGHNAVKPHFVGPGILVVVVVVEDVGLFRVEVGIGKVHPPRLVRLQVGLRYMAVGLFREPEYFRHGCSFRFGGPNSGWTKTRLRRRRTPGAFRRRESGRSCR